MGGFAVDVSDHSPPGDRFLPIGSDERWILSLKGLKEWLGKQDGRGELPNMSEEDIKSKSRANGFAKGLVCVQAGWFCLQCVTRLAQRMPISLLELNTLGHAVCAMLIYWLWWDKPFDVELPTTLQGETLRPYIADKWMRKRRSPACDELNRSVTDRVLRRTVSETLPKVGHIRICTMEQVSKLY